MKFLFNVGAEKAGTTWLYAYFMCHPEFTEIGKELNAIQRDDFWPTFPEVSTSFKSDLNNYFSYFQKLNVVSGDFTHYEGSTENVFRLIKAGLKKYDIDVVPVYIMRDPIKRAWSAWNMYGGGEKFDLSPAAHAMVSHNLQCKYKETVEALDNTFAKPLYFFYEDFFKQEDVDKICNELGISSYDINPEVVNKGNYDPEIPVEFIEKFCLTEKNIRAVDFVFERFENVPWNTEDYRRQS